MNPAVAGALVGGLVAAAAAIGVAAISAWRDGQRYEEERRDQRLQELRDVLDECSVLVVRAEHMANECFWQADKDRAREIWEALTIKAGRLSIRLSAGQPVLESYARLLSEAGQLVLAMRPVSEATGDDVTRLTRELQDAQRKGAAERLPIFGRAFREECAALLSSENARPGVSLASAIAEADQVAYAPLVPAAGVR